MKMLENLGFFNNVFILSDSQYMFDWSIIYNTSGKKCRCLIYIFLSEELSEFSQSARTF